MNWYSVSEDRLIELLEAEMLLATLEQDGVENWDWYMESARSVARDFTPEDLFEDADLDSGTKELFQDGASFEKVARARLEYGEFALE